MRFPLSIAMLVALLALLLAACGAAPGSPGAGARHATETPVAPQAAARPSATPQPTTPPALAPRQSSTPVAAPSPTAVATQAAAALPTPEPATPAPTSTSAPQPQPTAPAAGHGTLSGQLSVQDDRPIPPGAILSVQLHEEGHGIGPFVLARQELTAVPDQPIAFSLTYDPAQVTPQFPHNLVVELQAPGRIPWTASYPVDLQGALHAFELTLQPPTGVATLTGSAELPASTQLPADAVLIIRLFNRQYPDVELGKLEISPITSGKLPFLFEYHQQLARDEHSYVLHAEVRSGGHMPLHSQLYPVISQGNPTSVELSLEQPAAVAAVTGTIAYGYQPDLPADTTLTIKLLDITGADGPELVVARGTWTIAGPGPLAFALEYDPALVQAANRRYGVLAAVRGGGKLLETTDQIYSPFVDGAPARLEIQLKPVN